MRTAGLIEITPVDKSADNIVNYNLKSKKTTGRWLKDPKDYQQTDLVSFHGLGGLARTVPSGAHSFLMTTRNGFRAHGLLSNLRHVAQCRTIVQSFDYQANPTLRPLTAHAMANALYERIKRYLQTRYGYRLDAGMVSTHIDDYKTRPNPNPVSKEKVIYPHLHSHIVLPAYNLAGAPIYPYLRKADLYQFQQMNDDIVTDYGLKDYYFQKVRRLIHPMSAYTLNGVHREKASDLEKAQQAFTEANNHAWPASRALSLIPAKFKSVRQKRNDYLHLRFNFQTKTFRDTQTGRKETRFTLNTFSRNTLLQTPWYALNNLRLLRWRDYKEARAERLFHWFDFTGVQARAVTFHDYRRTIQAGVLRIHKIVRRSGHVHKVSLKAVYAEVQNRDVKNRRKYDNLDPDMKLQKYLQRQFAGESLRHGADDIVQNADKAIARAKTAKPKRQDRQAPTMVQHPKTRRRKPARSRQPGITFNN